MKRICPLIFILAFIALAVPAAAAEKGADKRLHYQIKTALRQNDLLKAANLAVKMKEFADPPTKYYTRAKEMLFKDGISIGDPLMSYTAIQLIKIQSKIEMEMKHTGNISSIGQWSKYTDAWGTPLRSELVEKPGFIYLVRSAGPDKKFMTDDDPIVVGQRPKGFETIKKIDVSDKKARAQSMHKSLLGLQTDAQKLSGGEAKPPKDEDDNLKDAVVELEDLLKKDQSQ